VLVDDNEVAAVRHAQGAV
jgi:hypothetical protein